MNVRRAAALVLILAVLVLVLLLAQRRKAAPRPPPGPDPAAAAFDAGELPPSALAGTPRDGGTLTVRAAGEPVTLNPAVSPDAWPKRMILHQVLETLVKQDPRDHPRYQVIPALASSWEESADHKMLTFHLRSGVKWHDGAPFDAADVVFTLDLLRNPKVDSEHLRPYLADVHAVTAPDPSTVVVTYDRPYVWALRRMSEIPILPRHLLAEVPVGELTKAPFSRAPVGTGPFRFVAWAPKESVTLARWDGYWGPKAHLDKLVFRMVPDANAAWQLLLRGDVDVDISLSSDQYAEAPGEPRIRQMYYRVKYFDPSFGFIAWNLGRPLFQDVRVRRALSMLLDAESLQATLYRGQPRRSTCIQFQEGPECDPATTTPPFDPAGASKLLAEAGWKDHDGDGLLDKDGMPFRFTASLPAGVPVNEQLLLAYKQDLYKAGIELDLQKLEWAAFLPRLHDHDFDAALFAIRLDPENDPYQSWHSSQIQGGSNYGQYRSPQADSLIEQIRGTFDEGERNALFRRLNQVVVDDQPITLLFDVPRRVLIKKRVHGAYLSPMLDVAYQGVWLEAEGP